MTFSNLISKFKAIIKVQLRTFFGVQRICIRTGAREGYRLSLPRKLVMTEVNCFDKHASQLRVTEASRLIHHHCLSKLRDTYYLTTTSYPYYSRWNSAAATRNSPNFLPRTCSDILKSASQPLLKGH